MSFVKRVQHQEISRPNQRSFKPDSWNAQIDPATADEPDKNLQQAGLWFYAAFEALRKQLSYAADKKIPRNNKLLAFITRANLNAMMYDDTTREIGQSTRDLDPVESSRLQIVPKLSGNNGEQYSLDEVTQADIDGLSLPIQMVLAQQGDPSELDIATARFDLKRVDHDYQLGAFYGVLEQYWEDCLWNDYRIDINDKVVLTPGNRHFAAWKVIGQFRRNILVHSKSNARLLNFQKYSGEKAHSELGIPRPIRALTTTADGVAHYLLADDHDVGRSSGSMFMIIDEAMEPYYTGYSSFHAPRLAGATINDVVKCWAVLWSLVKCLLEAPAVPPETLLGDPLLVHAAAPLIDKAALTQAISESLGISAERSLAVIDFLTFDHTDKSDSGKNELWTQPLIPYSNDKLLILFTPLLCSTTQRNVNIWLRQMGADLAERGNSFETHVRQVLAHYAEVSRLKKHTRLMMHAFKFNLPKTAAHAYEDIDLLLLIGNTLVVGEVKCFLQPADALSTFGHRKKVVGACDQLARKLEYIRDHEKSFRKQCLKANFRLPEKFTIQPVVVLNGPAHCGIPYNGTPIVDVAILSTFFTGVIRQNIIESIAEGVVSEDRIILYTDLASAQSNLADYLTHPPQLAYIKNGLTEKVSGPHHNIASIDDLCYRHFEVVL